MDLHFKLGGLMGASPYSNVSIIDAAASQRFQRPQQMRYNRDHPRQQQYGAAANFQQNSSPYSSGRMASNSNYPLIHLFQQGTMGAASPNVINASPIIKFDIPDHVVQDIICRFILNVPEEEKFDPVRALFQIELAHWFFVDYYCDSVEHPELAGIANIPFNQFAYIIFQKTPQLTQYFSQIDKYLAEFRAYRSRIPTYGAILMNQELTKVVLVQGFRNQWGFPKGKINEVEDPVDCAVREVFEETGYNMRPLLNPSHFIESKAQDRNDRLYLIRGVDMNFNFTPQTNYEIKSIAWFNIDELPEHKRDTNPKILSHGHSINNFYTVYPYIKRLRFWIADKIEGKNKIQCFRSKWFNSDKDEEDSNNINYQNYGARAGMTDQAQANSQPSQLGRAMTPGEEILRSVQGGFSAFKKTVSTKKPDDISTANKNLLDTNRGDKKYTKGSKSKKHLFPETKSSTAAKENSNLSKGSSVDPTKQPNKVSLADSFTFSCSLWENFSLDKERVQRALMGETNPPFQI